MFPSAAICVSPSTGETAVGRMLRLFFSVQAKPRGEVVVDESERVKNKRGRADGRQFFPTPLHRCEMQKCTGLASLCPPQTRPPR